MQVKAINALPSNSRSILLSIAAAILGIASLAASSLAHAVACSFTQIEVPGADSTRAFGINDAGQIVGGFFR